MVSKDQFELSTMQGKGGYGVYLSTDKVYDCWKFRHICYASHANSALNCINVMTGHLAVSNARIAVSWNSSGEPVVALRVRCKSGILRSNNEILTPYSKSYMMPIMPIVI